MTKICSTMSTALLALAAVAMSALAHADVVLPVTNWVAHNGPGVPTITDGATNSPTFNVNGTMDDTTVMGTFPKASMVNDGDFIKLTTTLTLTGRTNNVGAVGLNTMLRLGIFDGPDGPVAAGDAGNLGFVIVYANVNQAANRQLRVATDPMQTNPIVGAANLAAGTDSGNQIQGANPGPVVFELTLTRNAGLLDIVGKISGNDSIGGAAYVANYGINGYDPGAIGFEFNRVGFFFGSQVNAPSALLGNVTVTSNVAIVPESQFVMLAATAAVGLITSRRRLLRSKPRRDQARIDWQH